MARDALAFVGGDNALLNFSALTKPLVALASSGVTGQPLSNEMQSALRDMSWSSLCKFAAAHDLLPLVNAGVQVSGIQPPADEAARLKKAARISEVRADIAWRQLRPIIAAFQAAGMRLMVLKGAQLAVRYYASPGLRPFGDLDLLVAENDRERAAALLMSLGYSSADDQDERGRAWWVENHYHWRFVRDGAFQIELHWNLTLPGSTAPIDTERLWREAEALDCGTGIYHVFSPRDELIFLAAHIAKHCFRLPLRSQADIAAVLTRSPALDWDGLWQRALSLGLQEDLLVVLATARSLGFISLPDAMSDRVETAVQAQFDLPLLVRYAAECPFVVSHERWLDVGNAVSRADRFARIRTALFAKSKHLWKPAIAPQAAASPPLASRHAWAQRAIRLGQMVMNIPKFVYDLRVTRRVDRMFRGRRGQAAAPR
jgi:hypothetical protein